MRVTRPGGTIGMINFTPEGHAGDFFSTFAPFVPGRRRPAGAVGQRALRHASCFDGLTLDLERREYVERVPGGPQGFVAFYRATFGPAAAIEDPRFAARPAGLRRAARTRASPAATRKLRFGYLRVCSRTAGVVSLHARTTWTSPPERLDARRQVPADGSTAPSKPTPVVIGVNWYEEFDEPVRRTPRATTGSPATPS